MRINRKENNSNDFVLNYLRITEDEYNKLLNVVTHEEKMCLLNPLTFTQKRDFIKIYRKYIR